MKEKVFKIKEEIFDINSSQEFEQLTLEIFRYQAEYNPVYSRYINLLGVKPENVKNIEQIPFLPIEFFKTKRIITQYYNLDDKFFKIFRSSGTTNMLVRSKHYIYDLKLYERSFSLTFERFIGNPAQMVIMALLPSYLEREDSSLIYMVNSLINSALDGSGFYLYNYGQLIENIIAAIKDGKKVLLFGVSFALLELAKKYPTNFGNNVIIIETGGMKSRGEEITRQQLHSNLKEAFGVNNIYSEYGMTELLSQSYALVDNIFRSPKWKKVLIRDINDPFSYVRPGRVGGLNIIDLANIYSCSFIETKDLGRLTDNGFELLGRFDNSDLRGCNLLVV